MIDFTNAKEMLNNYSGSEKKKTLILNNVKYMVKFPDPVREKDKEISYINNTYSEYIGSTIFSMSGFKTQETILGTYKINDKTKIICACKDFTDEDNILITFENSLLGADTENKVDTDIEDISTYLKLLKDLISIKSLEEDYFDMFIVDALIGNTDRHNGNWGFLYNTKSNTYSPAPIFDNGSCLNPLLSDEDIQKLSETEIKNLAINVYSCLKDNDKKINYFSYIKSKKNNVVNASLIRVFNNIDIESIIDFINNIECISNDRKRFYISLLKIRYDVLKEVYEELK